MTRPDAFAEALAMLGSERLEKSRQSMRRHEQRIERLQRRARILAQKRSQGITDPMARALAKAKSLAEKPDESR